ncbi:hypothetical protein AALP_AA8G063700 [Arabis alpina]|uniref:Uncharacterized protein n=1 Tax=Arabis alpina TaxID=50452 RepID=A0A087G5D0_ARAAL|nr:hypothetical protein AALP_AA8G063700 [Arabis alpina]
MASDGVKYMPIHGGGATTTTAADIKSFFSVLKPKKTSTFAYAFVITFVSFTLFFAFTPSINSSSPWFSNIFSSSTTTPSSSDNTSRSQFNSIFSYIIPNVTSTIPTNRSSDSTSNSTDPVSVNTNSSSEIVKNDTLQAPAPEKQTPVTKNVTFESPIVNRTNPLFSASLSNQTRTNQTKAAPAPTKAAPVSVDLKAKSNSSTGSSKPVKQSGNSDLGSLVKQEIEKWSESLKNCEFFDGEWIMDDSYPLYKPGSCKIIDEQFNCISNGRPDKDFQKLKWKPKKCSLPRLNGPILLEMLRGRRLVFVGDSLNRNMWESLVCFLKGSVKDESKVYEARGRHHFRGEAEYSFVFQDYNCTVEFFVSPFLVQETEIVDKKGTKKETLRLDLVGKSSEQYKGADIIVFNTGHWWTHEKTSKGEDYYQEGSNVYHELAVLEAFRKALTTWGRWVEKNVNPEKSLVFFRGYSASHFSGGQWNSGGACDSETEPIKNDTYLTPYPAKMKVLEKVLRGMKTPVTYLNITRLTDYRKDGHPSVYRKHSLSEKEKKSPLLYQDCSHWCLPGVPDSWNEILYAELLVKLNQLGQTRRKP